MKIYDLVIIGGGIIGLAVANDLIKRNSKLKILVVKKILMLLHNNQGIILV